MSKHTNPIPTIDVVLQQGSDILLIKRKNPPFKDHLALPGGFVFKGESVEDAAKRKALEETSLEIEPIEILGVYSDPKRDPRTHTVTVVFVGIILNGLAIPDNDALEWVPLDGLQNKNLAFDYKQILSDYSEWRRSGGTFWSFKRRTLPR
jgi:8-oxo-dGTP diphosphatase